MTIEWLAPYQQPTASAFDTDFWKYYQTFTNIEARFDLIFRRDGGVAVWTANRVRHYYDFAGQMGLYNVQESHDSNSAVSNVIAPIPDPVEVIIQTGAGGPTATNRARGAGCIYTDGIVRRLLSNGRRVLMVHDAPEMLEPLNGLTSVTFGDFRRWGKLAGKKLKLEPHELAAQDQDFWARVAESFATELGVKAPDPLQIGAAIESHRRAVLQHGALLDILRPNASIMMTHYMRAPQIEAAQARRIWVVDYQHGIHSRFHMGYGYPSLRADHRAVPYLPDEHWLWGKAWVSDTWWPEPLKKRLVGLDLPRNAPTSGIPFDSRPQKTLLIASSWAMADDYRTAIRVIAHQAPDWTFQIKLHPREKVAQYAELKNQYPNVEVISGDVDIHAAAQKVRYVSSICSSALFDVLLDGCKIAVWNLPSVEYAEDIARDYGVPVLEPDGSNFQKTIQALETQSINVDDFFHEIGPIARRLQEDSLTVPIKFLTPALLHMESKTPSRGLRIADRFKPIKRSLARHFPAVFRRELPIRNIYLTALADLQKAQEGSTPLNKLTKIVSNAISDGLPPAMFETQIRSIISAKKQKNRKVLLRQIAKTNDPSSAILRAEMMEHLLSVKVMSRPLPSWELGQAALGQLSADCAVLGKRYASVVRSAKASFPDTRVSQSQQKSLVRTLATRLREPEPFSMVRIGVGEAYAFAPDYIAQPTQDQDYARREMMWWSSHLNPALRQKLQSAVRDAICNSDALGIPSMWRLLRDLPRQVDTMRGPIEYWSATARAHFVLSEELAKMAEANALDWGQKTLLDDQCQQELFTLSNVKRFMKSGRPAVVVSCFEKDQLNAVFGKAVFEKAIRIPPHSRVKHLVPDDAVAQARMPDMMDDLIAQVDRYAADGAVFFMAGGFAGKILLNRAKISGGAGLDIGAAADYWMGFTTRGPMNFTQIKQGGENQ